jgi:hypothetical protein
MVLKLICAQVMLTKLAVRGAFTLGAVAGTAGVIGLCALRKAMKALVGAIIVVEGGGPVEDQRLSQRDVDSLLKELMP